MRTALGAGRARLVRFVMMESLLLSGFGAALGLALAYAGAARDSGAGNRRHSATG